MVATREDIVDWVSDLQHQALTLSHNQGLSLEDRFWTVDDVVCALAPDGDADLYARWEELFKQCKAADPTFKMRRDKIRNIAP